MHWLLLPFQVLYLYARYTLVGALAGFNMATADIRRECTAAKQQRATRSNDHETQTQ